MPQLTEDIISAEQAGTLDGLMYERVRRTPDVLAYRSYDADNKRWRDTTWGEVGREISRWQAALAAEGLAPGKRVAVHLRNSKEWVFFDQAALACGLVIVPLYTDDRPDNIAYILDNAAVKVLLVQDVASWKRLAPALAGQEDLQRVLILKLAPVHLADRGVTGPARALCGRLVTRAAACTGPPQRQSPCAGVDCIHLRDHRPAQGRHAQSLQYAVDRACGADHDRCV